MIKCEVVFDGSLLSVNDWDVSMYRSNEDHYEVSKCEVVEVLSSLEEAIKYCLEN